jgi:hypothetical protein
MSAFATVCDNMLTALRASSALSGVGIYDGLQVTMEFTTDGIAVGHDGSTDDDDVSVGSVSQDYAPLGAVAKYEDGTVNCFLWSLDGGTDVTVRRTRAFALLAAIEVAVKADPTLSGACMLANVASADISLRQTTQGVAILMPFTLTYRARLT